MRGVNVDLVRQHVCKFQQDVTLSDVLLGVVLQTPDQKQIFLEMFEALDLCFERETRLGHEGKEYFFPWFVQDEFDGNMEDIWPQNVSKDEIQLEVHYRFCHRLPPTAFERLVVKIQPRLRPQADLRQYWKNMAYFRHNGVQIVLARHMIQEHPYIEIKLRSRYKDFLYQLYSLCYDLCFEMNNILLTCPGVVADKYLICPHCAILGTTRPKQWRLDDEVLSKPDEDRISLCCEMPSQSEPELYPQSSKRSSVTRADDLPAAMIMLQIIGNYPNYPIGKYQIRSNFIPYIAGIVPHAKHLLLEIKK